MRIDLESTSSPVRRAALLLAAAGALGLAGCAGMAGSGGWTTLIEGTQGLDNFNRVGDANWAAADGAIEASRGTFPPGGYLVTKQAYKDVAIRAEVWVSDDANSGIFARCRNPQQITDETCYEANLFDQRPGQEYSTGAIVKVATVAQPAPKAGGKWNTMDFTLQGDRLVVKLNGATTVDVRDAKLAAAGPIALQWGRGTVKFRKVQVQPL